MRFAAIDLGGSFVKSAVIDTAGGPLQHVRRDPFPPFLTGLDPSFREVALPAIAEVFFAHLDRLIELEPGCRGIFVSTQMHGFALVDASGRAASNFISWQDQRADFRDFDSRLSPEDRECIGNETGAGHAATVLFASAHRNLIPLPLPNALFTTGGHAEAAADITLAASFGVLDVRAGTWHSGLLAKLGLDRFTWPRVTRWNEVIGRYRNLPIYSPVGDQQAALLGAELRGELSINIGTGSQVSALADTFRSGPFKVRPWFDGRFLRTVTHLPAGRALNALVRMTRTSWDEIDRAVDALATTDLAVDLSFFHDFAGRRGSITNIHERNFTPGDLFLAAYANMAANYAAAAERLFPRRDWGPLVLSGGLAHRAARLRALIAQRLERDVRLSASEDETLDGLRALAAGLA